MEPGITCEEIKSMDGDIEKQWCFPRCVPNEQEEREIIARCAEIATRTIFENFCYKFAGKTYKQTDGGPIGARVTMCLARVVMHNWGEQYSIILTRASLRVALLSSYVDDVRQGTTILRYGMRFDQVTMEFKWNMGAEEEDRNLKELEGESSNSRMRRICMPAMNAINPDLQFTAEIPEDYKDGKVPTLDFKAWQMKDYRLNHSYFEKEMRTPYVIMKKSAISDHSRYNILANELVRRLSNIKIEENSHEEVEEVIEHFITQCKTSGYSRHETREGVISGIKGWKRKHQRRERDGQQFYRSARSTLAMRTKKKLTEKTSWYKNKRKRHDEEGEEREDGARSSPRKKRRTTKPTWDLEALMPKESEGLNATEQENQSAIAVLFVPYTEGAELAKRYRDYEKKMKGPSGWFFKIVERAGDSLVDLLHRSDPWSGEDCRRQACL